MHVHIITTVYSYTPSNFFGNLRGIGYKMLRQRACLDAIFHYAEHVGIQIYSFIDFLVISTDKDTLFSLLFFAYHFQLKFCCNIHITKRRKKISAVRIIGEKQMKLESDFVFRVCSIYECCLSNMIVFFNKIMVYNDSNQVEALALKPST